MFLQERSNVRHRFTGIIGLLALIATLLVSMPGPAHAQTNKDSTFYVVMAHADDEQNAWQLIDDFQDHYTVFVTTTQGEGTWACLREEETWDYPQTSETPFPKNSDGTPMVGPYMYEGPDSPVGQPDLGERHPLGNPWSGQGSEECKRARTASWHWFLDDMSVVDPGFPNMGISDSASGDPWLDDDYQGEFCPPGTNGSENGPDRKRVGCVDVWANKMGARVAFDFGNGSLEQPQPFTESEVVTAIEMLRANRANWGISVLPEAGIMSAAPSCDFADDGSTFHDQHETVTNAIYNHDFGVGPQYGAVCDGNTNQTGTFLQTQDPNDYMRGEDYRYAAHPGYQQPPDAAEWAYMNSFDPITFERTGPVQVNYGWLAEGNLNTPIDEHTGQHYSPGAWDFPFRTMWKRYGDETKQDMFYVVLAHPDDEMNSWSMVDANIDKDTYGVFVTLTNGEGTTSCLTPDDPMAHDGAHHTEAATFVEGIEANVTLAAKTGAYKYQGPDSPVNQEDMGERHPLGFPWQGQGTQACKDARIASWHWFLDDVNEKFGLGTSFSIVEDPRDDDDYLGRLCGREETSDVCADVWANAEGARVAFDLGNTKAIGLPDGTWTSGDALFDVNDVIRSLQTLLTEKVRWGLPDLPGAGMVSGSTYYKGTGCAEDANPDHKLIQDALHDFDFGQGPQFGPLLCELDPYGTEAGRENQVLDPRTLVEIQLVDPVTENRAGSVFNENYGWLFPTYLYTKSAEQYFRVFD